MRKLKLAILRNEMDDNHDLWVEACRERRDQVEWKVVDITRSDWLKQMTMGEFDAMLAVPPGWTLSFKAMYDERLTVLHEVLGLPVYPSLPEILIYENKKLLAYWLAAQGIPHPETWVFYYKKEALDFLETARLPLVGKINIGAGGRGVRILKTRANARDYVINTFSGKGASRSLGPNWKKKGLLKRAVKILFHPQQLKAKLDLYRHQQSEGQKYFVLLQEYIPHTFEWRCVRIGDSFFAHKKLVDEDMASGSLLKGYGDPPLALLDFIRKLTDRYDLWSQAIDLFETEDGRYLVNEMQCIFGQSDPYQMLVDGEPGRYLYRDGEWVFEAGDFNRLESYALRMEHVIHLFTRKTEEVPDESTIRS